MPKKVVVQTFASDDFVRVSVKVHRKVLLVLANKCRTGGWNLHNGRLNPTQIISAAIDASLFQDGNEKALASFVPEPEKRNPALPDDNVTGSVEFANEPEE